MAHKPHKCERQSSFLSRPNREVQRLGKQSPFLSRPNREVQRLGNPRKVKAPVEQQVKTNLFHFFSKPGPVLHRELIVEFELKI